MESVRKIPSTQTLCSFLALAVIRGSFAVLIHYGIASYKTPSLLFLLRTPGTLVLFIISVFYLASKEEESKLEILNNFKSSRLYKRAALLGFFQLCGPYMLFMYGMKYLSPTIGAVFMCGTPWATALLEKFLSLTVQRSGGKDWKIWNAIGSVIGVIGLVAVTVGNLCHVTMDTSCQATYTFRNVTTNISNGTHGYVTNVTVEKVELHADTCLTELEITTAFLALCGATCLWSISAVFSRLKRVNIHFLVGGLLNNAFGGLYSGVLWVILEQHINTSKVAWDSTHGSISVIFLSVASSWAASLILYYLYRKIGAESTNRVMCLVPVITWLEDIILLHHYKNMFTWIVVLEVIGLILVVTGLYISSYHQEQTTLQGAHAYLLPDYVSEEEGDGFNLRQVTELNDTVQSEEELMQSGSSSMQDSVEPPMIHYADDENYDEGEVW